ncbi:MAG: BamA/TamA family outer membrane protein [Fibromonadales bacterium]|nr:BamA/TamA family outer membrane protein [Fibromonadales bacterium]
MIFFRVILLLSVISAATEITAFKLRIIGSKIYSEEFLKEQLDLPAEIDAISPERRAFIIKLSKSNLEYFYQNNGYFSEHISLTVSEENLDTAKIEVYTFNIYEGEKYRFGTATIVLEEDAKSFVDVEKLSIMKGGIYDPDIISNDRKTIEDAYLKLGYLHITVEHLEHIDTLGKKVNIYFMTDPKHQVRMGYFNSQAFRAGLLPGQTEPETGLSDTAWLNKLWEIKRDSIVDQKYFSSFRTKLLTTQLFSQVKLEDSLQENSLSDISLTVYERVPGEAYYGFFFEQIYGFGISYSALHRNFFGSFHEAGIGAMLAQNRQEISLNYAHPLFFGTSVSWIPTAIRLEEKIFFNHEKLPAPTKPDSLVERWEIVSRANLSFGLSARNHIRNRHTFDFRFLRLRGGEEEAEDYFKLKYEWGLTFDFTDNSYDPVKGWKLTPNVGAGGELQHESLGKVKDSKSSDFWKIGLEHGFFYTETSLFGYYPIFRKYLLSAFAFSYGNIFNKAPEDDAQMFYQGGGRTLRGYKFRTVFPYKMENDTTKVSGRSPEYFRINEELRVITPWKPLRNWQLVQFIDWVNIGDSDESFSIAQEMSLGMGLRYKWQFLTFRLDYVLKTQFHDFKPDKFSWSHIVFDLSQAI